MLRMIAESLDYIAAERLQPDLVPMARRLAAHGELSLSPRLEQDLKHMSVSTVRRVLELVGRADACRLPRKWGHGSPLPQGIPMRRIPWDESELGHFETGLVHDCGCGVASIRFRHPSSAFATDAITPQERQRLEQPRNQTNPRALRREIYNPLDRLFETPGAAPGITVDAHQTFSAAPSMQKGEGILVTLSID